MTIFRKRARSAASADAVPATAPLAVATTTWVPTFEGGVVLVGGGAWRTTGG
ncbi:hypothetical protein [Mycobacterium angelicum]|uniref:hypothetical protein n=1 Tax=Mycobacterium angelicum TaxID=470074 RepID=UPI0014750A4D|nr:hypothetical protein [Mycobacterium angelicum]MCV7195713.1 hypothetical protein [Mycobacterium angelicum]